VQQLGQRETLRMPRLAEDEQGASGHALEHRVGPDGTLDVVGTGALDGQRIGHFCLVASAVGLASKTSASAVASAPAGQFAEEETTACVTGLNNCDAARSNMARSP